MVFGKKQHQAARRLVTKQNSHPIPYTATTTRSFSRSVETQTKRMIHNSVKLIMSSKRNENHNSSIFYYLYGFSNHSGEPTSVIASNHHSFPLKTTRVLTMTGGSTSLHPDPVIRPSPAYPFAQRHSYPPIWLRQVASRTQACRNCAGAGDKKDTTISTFSG